MEKIFLEISILLKMVNKQIKRNEQNQKNLIIWFCLFYFILVCCFFLFFLRQKAYCRSHSKCPCGAPGAPGFLGAVFFCSCLIKGESRVHNLAICSFFWGSVVVWVLMGGEGGEKDVDCPIGW